MIRKEFKDEIFRVKEKLSIIATIYNFRNFIIYFTNKILFFSLNRIFEMGQNVFLATEDYQESVGLFL